MITAKTANNKAFETKEAKELLKEKHYLEVLKHVEDRIIEATKSGYFNTVLRTDFMYPFRDKVIGELTSNGYKVKLHLQEEYQLVGNELYRTTYRNSN